MDRIVPGKPDAGLKAVIENEIGYNDDLLLMSEAYRLWAIEERHTHISSGVAFLSGIKTVKDAMDDINTTAFISSLMRTEIAVAIPYPTTKEQTENFSLKVLDRFCNPYIDHQSLSNTAQYSLKLRARVILVLLHYYNLYNTIPLQGFADAVQEKLNDITELGTAAVRQPLQSKKIIA